MLDQMSGGRLEVGVGKGISSIESSYYGLDPEEVTAMYQEYYQFLLAAMKSDEVTFVGKYFSVNHMPIEMKPLQQPHPPLWNGFGNPNATAWPAENAINIISNHNAETMRTITDAYRAEWHRLGRDLDDIPMMGMTRFLVIAGTDDAALAIARRIYPIWYASFMKLWWRHDKIPPLAVYTEDFDGVVASGLAIAGSAKTVHDILTDHIEDGGINYLVCRFAFGNITYQEAAYSIDAFNEMFLSN